MFKIMFIKVHEILCILTLILGSFILGLITSPILLDSEIIQLSEKISICRFEFPFQISLDNIGIGLAALLVGIVIAVRVFQNDNLEFKKTLRPFYLGGLFTIIAVFLLSNFCNGA